MQVYYILFHSLNVIHFFCFITYFQLTILRVFNKTLFYIVIIYFIRFKDNINHYQTLYGIPVQCEFYT